jgi:ATP/ADP translocase
MVKFTKAHYKSCVCDVKDSSPVNNEPGKAIGGVIFQVTFAILSVISLGTAILTGEVVALLVIGIWLTVNALDYLLTYIRRRTKRHSPKCAIRYALINLLYVGPT